MILILQRQPSASGATIGYVQRVNRKGPCRRVSDWVDLQDESKGERHGTK